jgi:hypothetical protein
MGSNELGAAGHAEPCMHGMREHEEESQRQACTGSGEVRAAHGRASHAGPARRDCASQCCSCRTCHVACRTLRRLRLLLLLLLMSGHAMLTCRAL